MTKIERYVPDRGDIVWINLDPRTGRKQSGSRPALVISHQELTQLSGMAIICPITSQIKGLNREVRVKGTSVDGVVLTFQVRAVDTHARPVSFMERAPSLVTRTVVESVKAIIE